MTVKKTTKNHDNVISLANHFLYSEFTRLMNSLQIKILSYARKVYGRRADQEAWCEYWSGEFEIPELTLNHPDYNLFNHWYLFHWLPQDSNWIKITSPSGGTIAENFMNSAKTIGAITQQEYALLKNLCSQHFSFFEILDTISPQLVTVRDLLSGKTAKIIHSKNDIFKDDIDNGSIFYGRSVAFKGTKIFQVLSTKTISVKHKNDVLKLQKALKRKLHSISSKNLREPKIDWQIRDCYFDTMHQELDSQTSSSFFYESEKGNCEPNN